ncbi:MAG: helix-hairpin-helix domain-containing protein, partial [Pseudomonadota bacterium]
KKRRRQNSRRTRGHRQNYTEVQVLEVLTGGAKAKKKASGVAQPKNTNNTGLPLTAKTGVAEAPAAAPAKAEKPKAEKKAAPKKDDAPAENGVAKDAPEGPLFAAPEGEPDQLTKIKGIGKVAERQLNEQGITTFAQIAALTADEIQKVDDYMPFSTAQIEDWQAQAKEMIS